MERVEVKEGKVYRITHRRKGTFTAKVTKVGDPWITVMLVEGKTTALCAYNVKFEGEEVEMRDSLISRAELVPQL